MVSLAAAASLCTALATIAEADATSSWDGLPVLNSVQMRVAVASSLSKLHAGSSGPEPPSPPLMQVPKLMPNEVSVSPCWQRQAKSVMVQCALLAAESKQGMAQPGSSWTRLGRSEPVGAEEAELDADVGVGRRLSVVVVWAWAVEASREKVAATRGRNDCALKKCILIWWVGGEMC